MATKLGIVATYYKKLQPIKSYNHLNMWSRKVTCKMKKHFFYTITMPIVTKPGRVVTYNKELPFIKSHPFYHVVYLVILISLIRFVGLESKCLNRHRFLICIILII